jgi:hypothetical protein
LTRQLITAYIANPYANPAAVQIAAAGMFPAGKKDEYARFSKDGNAYHNRSV